MGLSKEQSYRVAHAERHAKNGQDPIILTDLKASQGSTDRILMAAANGDVVTAESENLYVTDMPSVSYLENELNWLGVTLNSEFGLQGQRVVSTITNYFYECVEDAVWVRYPIAMSYFNMYLTNTGNDANIRQQLENDNNWSAGNYIGQQISYTFQGQAHYSSLYKYEAVQDNLWIRIPRQ